MRIDLLIVDSHFYFKNMDSKTIYGQAWIAGDQLVQEQTIITTSGITATNIAVLIDNIWENLLGEGTEYVGDSAITTAEDGKVNNNGYYFKYNSKTGKYYFFFVYNMTSIDDDDVNVIVKLDCPRPKEGIFDSVYEGKSFLEGGYRNYEEWDPEKFTGEYAKDWVKKLKTTAINSSKKSVIQVKEVTLTGHSTPDPVTQKVTTTDDITITNDDLGDITNLLGIF